MPDGLLGQQGHKSKCTSVSISLPPTPTPDPSEINSRLRPSLSEATPEGAGYVLPWPSVPLEGHCGAG